MVDPHNHKDYMIDVLLLNTHNLKDLNNLDMLVEKPENMDLIQEEVLGMIEEHMINILMPQEEKA